MCFNFLRLLLAIGFTSSCFAQLLPPTPLPLNDLSTYRHYPFFLNSKKLWGYADVDGKILINPAFQQVQGFYKGFAGAKGEKAWGIINEKGAWVVQPEYELVECRDNIDAFILKKNGEHIVKYVVNGSLADEAPPQGDVYVTMFKEIPYENISSDRGPKHEIRRSLNEITGTPQLVEYIIRHGRPDSVVSSQQFDFYTFGEPIKNSDGRMFSLTNSKGKVGVYS